MSVPARTGTSQIGSVDARRVEDAFALIAPKWTTWTAQTLAQHGGLMRVREVAEQLPFLSEQFVGKRLAQMHTDGLATRPAGARRGAPYQLSEFGSALQPVHRALATWSQDHLDLGTVASAERVEDALRRLSLRNSTTVIQLLHEHGPMRHVEINEATGLGSGLAAHRLHRLQLDGLVTRSGPRHGDPYLLTDAGRALGPVYAAVEQWAHPIPTPAPAATIATAVRTRTGPLPGADSIRAAAALRRSTTVPGGLFSHAPQPQPRVPRAVTARSAPVSSR
jgi:DNA-binding HxlR family transcriptional regulator